MVTECTSGQKHSVDMSFSILRILATGLSGFEYESIQFF
jgi:hypothetical protein